MTADSPDAVAWSLEGALERIIGAWEGDEHRTALLFGALGGVRVDLAEFNGTVRSQEVVVALLYAGRAYSIVGVWADMLSIRG